MYCEMTVFHSVLIHNKQLVQLLFRQFRKHGFMLPAVIHVPVIINCFALERHLAQAVKTMPDCQFIMARRFLHTSSPPPSLRRDKGIRLLPFRCICQIATGRCSGGCKKSKNFLYIKNAQTGKMPAGRCLYLLFCFLHNLRVRIVHSLKYILLYSL